MGEGTNKKPPEQRSRLPDFIMLSFIIMMGGYRIISGICRETPYLQHYKGTPYLAYPAEDLLFGVIIISLAVILWWRYMRRGSGK